MESMKLNCGVLMAYVSQAIFPRQDSRKASNATRYKLSDAVLGAFSGFFMQSEFFWEDQRQRESHQGKNYARTLFSVTYLHSAILPIIVAPEQSQVISLAPEFITPQDGREKQDCEVAAAKRWVASHACPQNQGHHLEHNFGHGQNHLAACLLTLNLLAFLFHTILHLSDSDYQQIRQKRGTRKGFFQDVLSLTKYLLFDAWQSLIEFMLYGSTPIRTANSS